MRARRLLGCGVAVLMAVTSSFATSATVAASAPGAGAQTPPPCPNNRPCELSVGLPGHISDLHVSPDSARVVFRHRDSAGVDQVYSVPVAGGAAPVKLNVTASATFRGISPDSRRVLYSGPPASGGNDALFSVPIEGPASAGIRIGNNVNDHITEAKISPDSRKVVFETLDEDRLIAVPIAGPANAGVRLTDRFVANGHLASWEISANSGSVVYGADQDTDEVFELYRVPLSLVENPDPPTTKLNGPLTTGGDVITFRLAPNDGPVVYRADQEVDNKRELYSVRLGGAGRVKISRPLPADWDVLGASTTVFGNEFGFSISSDGNRVVYLTSNDAGDLLRLDSVPITGPGTASVRLDAPSASTGTFERVQHLIGPDSTRVIYVVPLSGEDAVYSVPIAGPASASALLTWPAHYATEAEITPNGDALIWHLDVGPVGGDEVALYRTPLDSVLDDTVKISGTEEPGSRVLINSTSTRVAYEADGEIFSAPTSGTGTRYNLTGSLDAFDIAFGGALTPNGQRIVYTVNLGAFGDPYHLYSSRLVPTG